MEPTIQECFDLLKISPDATIDSVDGAYRRLCDMLDPSRYPDSPETGLRLNARRQQLDIAYRRVRAYLSATSATTGNETAQPPADASRDDEVEKWSKYWDAKNAMEHRRSTIERTARRRGSGFFRFFLLMMVPLFFSGIYLIAPSIREIAGRFLGWQPAMEKSQPGGAQDVAGLAKAISDLPRQMKNLQQAQPNPTEGAQPARPQVKSRIEIHMDNGRIIYTSGYRIEGEIIRYKTAGGEMGVPRNRVKAIRTHAANAAE